MVDTDGEVGGVRLFVGGLSSQVSSVDLKERFTPLGTVLNVTTPSAKYGSGPHRGFAYVDFLPTSEASLRKLFSAYNGCKWRGGVLRIEAAREHYVDKLQKEWTAEAEALAAKEAELLRKKDDVPAVSPAKQAKSWPLLLLEQPEEPNKWKKNRELDPGAQADGIKIFFPRLKKMKTVPSKGLGKHKRSFQRVESLTLQQLSSCDCNETLHSGLATQAVAGNAPDELVTYGESNGESDPISLAIAKERQRQLDLLNKLFPSDSPRNSEAVNELTISSASNGAEIKKTLPRVDEDAMTEANDLDRRLSTVKSSSSHLRKEDDSGELIVPMNEDDASRDASETVKKVGKPEAVSPTPPKAEESPELQAEEPEMWVSFMDTMPLPAKTEENISEFDLDVLSTMLSEEEEEIDEEEEAVDVIPDSPKKKAKRRKKKGKKSKKVVETEPGSEDRISMVQADESDVQLQTTVASPSSSREVSESRELPTASREDVGAPAQPHESKKHEGVSLPSQSLIGNLRADEPKASVSNIGAESSDDKSESSDDDSDHSPSFVDDKDEFFVRVSSSDESLDSEADEGEMWVSGIDDVERAPTYVRQADPSSKNPYSQSNDSVSEMVLPSIEKEAPSAASDDRMESEGYERDVLVSSLKPMEDEETSEERDSEDEEQQPELWVSGLESTTAVPQTSNEVSTSDSAKVSTSTGEVDGEPSTAAALASTFPCNGDEIPTEKTQEVKPKEERSSEPGTVRAPLLSGNEEVSKGSQGNEASQPNRNELSRATWRSLVGETGHVVFSLQEVLGEKFSHLTPATEEPLAAQNTHPEEKSSVSDVAQGNDTIPSMDQHHERKLGTKNTAKTSVKSRKEVLDVETPPLIPVFTDLNVCPFMKSPDAEREWLATKSDLRTDYRSKHKQAVKKSRKLRGK